MPFYKIIGKYKVFLEATKATERRQESDRNVVYSSVTFLSLFLALDGLWLGLWLALVGLMGSFWGYFGAICKQQKRQKGDRKVTEI